MLLSKKGGFRNFLNRNVIGIVELLAIEKYRRRLFPKNSQYIMYFINHSILCALTCFASASSLQSYGTFFDVELTSSKQIGNARNENW